MKDLLFLIVLFVSNVIQAITGFAGTVLAMPPSAIAKREMDYLILGNVQVVRGMRKGQRQGAVVQGNVVDPNNAAHTAQHGEKPFCTADDPGLPESIHSLWTVPVDSKKHLRNFRRCFALFTPARRLRERLRRPFRETAGRRCGAPEDRRQRTATVAPSGSS